jgi:hypothetical protein
MSLTGSEVSQVWGKFSQNIAADRMRFVYCILRKNKRKCHIVCSCLLQSIISLFHLKYKDLKKVLLRPSSPCMSEFTVSGWENKWRAVPANVLFPLKSGYFFTIFYHKMTRCLIYLVIHVFTFSLAFVVTVWQTDTSDGPFDVITVIFQYNTR